MLCVKFVQDIVISLEFSSWICEEGSLEANLDLRKLHALYLLCINDVGLYKTLQTPALSPLLFWKVPQRVIFCSGEDIALIITSSPPFPQQ